MKSKKSYIVMSLIFVIGLFLGVVVTNKIGSNSEEGLLDSSSKQVVKENTLSMMIEQTAGAGDYKMETRSTWPTDGYMFNATLSKCENGGILGWNSEKGVVTMIGNMSNKCYIYFDKVLTLASYIKSLYTGVQGENSIYYHNSSLTNGAGDNSYRYAGASSSVNNYVCFGSNTDTCPTDNLYRIIGVFGDQVKLIKSTKATSDLLGTNGDYDSGTSYYWNYKNNTSINNGLGSNTWSTSLLNKTNLNTNYITYLNNINTKWADMIATTTWKVGGNTYSNIASSIPKTAYANEITNPVTTNSTDSATTYSAKIGLMYVSDYGFAASPSAWSTALSSYNSSSITSVNWMYMGLYEWTISRRADSSFFPFSVDSDGRVSGSGFVYDERAVRPVFYLTSSATYSRGVGTSSEPIRLG